MPTDTHGARRRRAIINAAIDLSTVDGLASLSLSRIADDVGLTKPGVAAHFASKEVLQLAIVEAAAASYAAAVTEAHDSAAPGVERLRALVFAWLEYLDKVPYRGGCFFAAAGHDFSGRPGAVRTRIAHHTRRFLKTIADESQLAARLGELRADVQPAALVFSLHALALEANLRRELLDDDDAFALARRALDAILRDATVPAGRAQRKRAPR